MGKIDIPEFDAMSLDEQKRVRIAVGPTLFKNPSFVLPWVAQLIGFFALAYLIPRNEWRVFILGGYMVATIVPLHLRGQRITRQQIASYLATRSTR
jgi:hypothetical protein